MVVSVSWEEVTSQLLTDETLRMKLQEEVKGGETVSDSALQSLVWVANTSWIMHSENHFLNSKLHKSLEPKPQLGIVLMFLEGPICLLP